MALEAWASVTVFAVGLVDLHAHFVESAASVDHLHHVRRDAYADVSGKAHAMHA